MSLKYCIASTDESINEGIFARLNESHLIFERNIRILCRKLFLVTMYKSDGEKKTFTGKPYSDCTWYRCTQWWNENSISDNLPGQLIEPSAGIEASSTACKTRDRPPEKEGKHRSRAISDRPRGASLCDEMQFLQFPHEIREYSSFITNAGRAETSSFDSKESVEKERWSKKELY